MSSGKKAVLVRPDVAEAALNYEHVRSKVVKRRNEGREVGGRRGGEEEEEGERWGR